MPMPTRLPPSSIRATGQHQAAQLAGDRVQLLEKQVAVLRKLRDCLHQRNGPTGLAGLDMRTGRDTQPALCSY
jgi:hypothetical protein